ncbi:MAG: hypothetical protein ACLUKN_17650 [Bacilli bacterium]
MGKRQGGFADHYPEIRSDMFLLFDDGWMCRSNPQTPTTLRASDPLS